MHAYMFVCGQPPIQKKDESYYEKNQEGIDSGSELEVVELGRVDYCPAPPSALRRGVK